MLPSHRAVGETHPMAELLEYEAEQIQRANASGKKPIVFVHGLWLLPSSWDRWAEVFEAAGFSTVTAGWPDDPNSVDEANRHPEVFAHKSVKQVADHVQGVIGELQQRRCCATPPTTAGPCRSPTSSSGTRSPTR